MHSLKSQLAFSLKRFLSQQFYHGRRESSSKTKESCSIFNILFLVRLVSVLSIQDIFKGGGGSASCMKIWKCHHDYFSTLLNRFHLHSADRESFSYLSSGLTVSCLRKKNEGSLRYLLTVIWCKSLILHRFDFLLLWLSLKSVVSKHLRGDLFDGVYSDVLTVFCK